MLRRRGGGARVPAAVGLVAVALLVAGCATGSDVSTPSSPTRIPDRTARPTLAVPTAVPSRAVPAATPAGTPDASICTTTTDAAVVAVTIEDFGFTPSTVQAETGEVITFSNTGFESHNATLDSGACATETLETGGQDGLLFVTTGEFPFHCTVHPWMTGMIVIEAAAALRS